MTVVWHAVPRNMIGDTVYPLTELRRVDAAAYESQRAKYAGREVVLDFRVPVLDVPFNATVHCSPVHPYRVFAARRLAGFEVQAKPAASSMITGLFFEIPVQRILVHEVLWYAWRAMWANGAPNEDAALAPPPEEFERFDPTRYIPLADVPPAHRDYLVARKANGRPALTFVHIPHVLVAGPIDVGGCRIISWSDRQIQYRLLRRENGPNPLMRREVGGNQQSWPRPRRRVRIAVELADVATGFSDQQRTGRVVPGQGAPEEYEVLLTLRDQRVVDTRTYPTWPKMLHERA